MSDFTEHIGYSNYKTVTFCWDITTSCQYRCSYCYALPWLTPVNKFKYSTAYKNVLKRLSMKSMPEFNIEILGGEPLLHKNINTILNKLSTNNKCRQIVLNTNMVYDVMEMMYIERVKISPSYHPESANPVAFCRKLLQLKKIGYHDNNLLVNINIHNDTRYIDDYLYILKFCAEHEIYAGANYLNNTPGYKCMYTDNFFNTLYKAVSSLDIIPTGWSMDKINWLGVSKYRHPWHDDVRVQSGDDIKIYNMGEIRDNKLNKWKGYKCLPLLWQIDPDGKIINECTNEPLKLDNSNIQQQVVCPCDECGWSDVHYKSYKHNEDIE